MVVGVGGTSHPLSLCTEVFVVPVKVSGQADDESQTAEEPWVLWRPNGPDWNSPGRRPGRSQRGALDKLDVVQSYRARRPRRPNGRERLFTYLEDTLVP